MLALAAILMWLPGIAAATWSCDPEEDDPLAALAASLVLAAAVWIVAFWSLAHLPLTLSQLMTGILGVSAALVLLRGRMVLALTRGAGAQRWVLLGFGILALMRLLPFFLAAAAPGADMSMHTYMGRLIADAGGVPDSYAPLLPIDDFGTFAAGLPALSAMLATLSSASIVDAAHLVAVLTHLLITLSVYVYCRMRVGPVAAFLAAVFVTVATRDPQAHYLWGGNPTILSAVFVIYGLYGLERLDRAGPVRPMDVIAPALAFSASVSTHSVLAYALVWVVPPVIAWRLLRRADDRLRVLLRGGLVAVLAAAFTAPYLTLFDLQLAPEEIVWIMNWQRLDAHVPDGPAVLLPLSTIWHIGQRLGIAFLVALVAAVALGLVPRRRDRPSIGEELIFSVGILLLVLNALVWWLPASYALYPDRIMVLLIAPAARILAVVGRATWPRLGERHPRARLGTALLVFGVCAWGYGSWYVSGLRNVSVQADDRAVFAWMAEHLPAGTDAETGDLHTAVIENNYGDAGIWIPAALGRPVRTPHANIVYLDEIKLWREQVRAPVLFVGAKQVYKADSPYTLDALLQRPDQFELLHRSGDAAVFKILTPIQPAP